LRNGILLASAVALAACATATAHAGTFRTGIVDPRPIPSATSAALNSSLQRYDLVWKPGVSSFTGTLQLSGGTQPVVAVYGPEYNGIPRDELGRQQFTAWVRSILTRYPRVRDVIVGNEPPARWWPYYPQLLRTVAPVIHSLGARVIGPGAKSTTPVSEQQGFVDSIVIAGPHLLDVWDQHGYWQNFPATIAQVRASFGWPIPFWVTEDGIDTEPDPPFAYLYRGSTPPEWHFWTSEAGQAQIVDKFMRRAYCAGAAVWMNYLLRDEVDLARWQSGLEHPDGSPKQAFAAYAATSRAIARGEVTCDDPEPPPKPRVAPSLWGASRPHKGQTGRSGGVG
jgi:hypothetical protein